MSTESLKDSSNSIIPVSLKQNDVNIDKKSLEEKLFQNENSYEILAMFIKQYFQDWFNLQSQNISKPARVSQVFDKSVNSKLSSKIGNRNSPARIRRRKLQNKSSSETISDENDFKLKLQAHEVYFSNYIDPLESLSSPQKLSVMDSISEEAQQTAQKEENLDYFKLPRPESRRNKRQYSESNLPAKAFTKFAKMSAKVSPSEDSSSSSDNKTFIIKRVPTSYFKSNKVHHMHDESKTKTENSVIFQTHIETKIGDVENMKIMQEVAVQTEKRLIKSFSLTEIPPRKRKYTDEDVLQVSKTIQSSTSSPIKVTNFLKTYIQRNLPPKTSMEIQVPKEDVMKRTEDWVTQNLNFKETSVSESDTDSEMNCGLSVLPIKRPKLKFTMMDAKNFVQNFPKSSIEDLATKSWKHKTVSYGNPNLQNWEAYMDLGSISITSSIAEQVMPKIGVRRRHRTSDCFCLYHLRRTFTNLFAERKRFF